MTRKILREHSVLLIFITIYFTIIAFKLLSHLTPFYDWDESINVEVGKEMIKKLSFVPLWQGKVWLDKPPLPFLFFGLIMKLTPFITPEISLRIVALILSVIALIFIYFLFFKATNNKLIANLSVITTAFTPIFFQRSQVVNLDVFLIIGWVGYLLFFDNFILSLFFLIIAVLTKSLIGFYAPGILFFYYLYLLIAKKINLKKFKRIFSKIIIQVGILSLWYIIMLLIFKGAFLEQHIIETHFRRITSSIESHFGKRTYYIDLLFEQLGVFKWPMLLGLLIVISNLARNLVMRKNFNLILYSTYLIPWFLFLNLTKTKIFWYLYPSIPQFAFLTVLPLVLVKKQKIIFYILGICVLVIIFYQNFLKTNFFTTYYSSYEDYYFLATYAKNYCNELVVLVGKDSRNTEAILEQLGLTISSTKQWGDHPSIVYYFGKKVDFIYDNNLFTKKISNMAINNCFTLQKTDLKFILNLSNYPEIKSFNSYYLYKKI